ncbi:MAG: putative quinol monooxygenase [Pseudomonadales bacterium]
MDNALQALRAGCCGLRVVVIIVHGVIPIRPDCREQALQMVRRMTEATRGEPGCVSYDFYISLSDPNSLMVFQEWESMETLMAHFQTPHMEAFLSELPHVVSGEITTRRYAVQSVDDDTDEAAEPPPVIH